jgi:hypothetical protein
MLRTIFALALFAYPAEFRRDYRSQLFLDLEDRTHEQGYALRLFFDVLVNGIFMRIENLWRDIAYAVRTLARAPLFTIVVAGTLSSLAHSKPCCCARCRIHTSIALCLQPAKCVAAQERPE